MNETLTLKSGITLELQMASFQVAMKLFKTIAAELRQVDVNLEGLDLQTFLKSDINGIKNVAFQLLSSDALEVAIFTCMERSLYDGKKITRATFESAESRPDFLPVAWEVMKYNLSPFFSRLDLSSSTKSPETGSVPT